jgi:hypothetical protein
VTDASHFVVFAVRETLTDADRNRHLARVAEVRGVAPASLAGFRQMVMGAINRPAAQIREWNARQAYLAMGNLMTSAALLGIDSCPMEGIEPEKFDELLGLPPAGYRTLAAVALGYRASADNYARLPKMRFPISEVVQVVQGLLLRRGAPPAAHLAAPTPGRSHRHPRGIARRCFLVSGRFTRPAVRRPGARRRLGCRRGGPAVAFLA